MSVKLSAPFDFSTVSPANSIYKGYDRSAVMSGLAREIQLKHGGGLVAQYLMQDATDEVNGYDLTNSGVTFDASSPIFGSASAWYNADTDTLYHASFMDKSFFTGFAFEIFFKPATTFDSGASNNEYFVYKANVINQDFFQLYLSSATGKLNFFTEEGNNGSINLISDQDSWTAGTIYHVVVVWTPILGKQMWIDGIKTKEDTSAGAKVMIGDGTGTNFVIGNSSGGTLGFNGHIDMVNIYTGHLLQSDIERHSAFAGTYEYYESGGAEVQTEVVNLGSKVLSVSDILIPSETIAADDDIQLRYQINEDSVWRGVGGVVGGANLDLDSGASNNKYPIKAGQLTSDVIRTTTSIQFKAILNSDTTTLQTAAGIEIGGVILGGGGGRKQLHNLVAHGRYID